MIQETINKKESELRVRHIGIIMDGNRRWAKSKGLRVIEGHKHGASTAKNIIKTAIECEIENLTLFAFSSENWKRKSEEINDLIGLLRYFLNKEIKNLVDGGVKLKILGDISLFPEDIVNSLKNTILSSQNNSKINLIIAINYGARQEITNSVKKIANEVLLNKIKLKDISEKKISESLYTSGIPDPDLIIRTGGDSRLSNFLLWQSAYSELIFIKKPWPDFTETDFVDAVNEFNNRERRFGGF